MLPAGGPTESTIEALAPLLAKGDSIIDGGNTFWRDDIRRGATLAKQGLHYLDVGTSGGVWGLERGYCLMIGGDADEVKRLDPIFSALAPGRGDHRRDAGPRRPRSPRRAGLYARRPLRRRTFRQDGPQRHRIRPDAGLCRGLRHPAQRRRSTSVAPEHRFDLDLADIAEVWRRGSVVTSWLLDLTSSALAQEGKLESYSGFIEDSGEGRWTLQAAIEEAVPAEVLSAALFTRFRSRQSHTFAEKIISAMRKGFGGHVEPKGK